MSQYAISFIERMNTYGGSYGIALQQDHAYVDLLCGMINAEIEKGSNFVKAVYVNNVPAVLIFEKIDMSRKNPMPRKNPNEIVKRRPQ